MSFDYLNFLSPENVLTLIIICYILGLLLTSGPCTLPKENKCVVYDACRNISSFNSCKYVLLHWKIVCYSFHELGLG